MRVDDRLGTFEEVAASGHPETLRAVRALVAELHPDAVEVASRRERSVRWGFGPAKMRDGHAHVMPHRDHVNLGFFQGTALPDPEGRLEGTGKALRHVKLRSPEVVATPGIRTLLSAVRDERRAALAK